MKREAERLDDILSAISKIQEKAQSRGEFFSNEMLQVWVKYHLQLIGEATNRVSSQTQTANPQVPWQDFIGLGNTLVKKYFKTDLELIWQVIEEKLPPLKQHIHSISQKE